MFYLMERTSACHCVKLTIDEFIKVIPTESWKIIEKELAKKAGEALEGKTCSYTDFCESEGFIEFMVDENNLPSSI